MSNISIIIGSWGSYNECDERVLGSKLLDLEDFDSFEEIEEELNKEGFELDGIDEELFIQDIDNANVDTEHITLQATQDGKVEPKDYTIKVADKFYITNNL